MKRMIIAPDRVTLLECTQCPAGTYAPTSSDARIWTCDNCGHDVHDTLDIEPYLEPGAHLTSTFIAEGEVRLAWTTHPQACSTCGTFNQHHFSVRIGSTMPSVFVNCPESE